MFGRHMGHRRDRLAVDKGYKILEILEIYEYQVTRYDPEAGNGGLFAEYIDTCEIKRG